MMNTQKYDIFSPSERRFGKTWKSCTLASSSIRGKLLTWAMETCITRGDFKNFSSWNSSRRNFQIARISKIAINFKVTPCLVTRNSMTKLSEAHATMYRVARENLDGNLKLNKRKVSIAFIAIFPSSKRESEIVFWITSTCEIGSESKH